MRSDPLPSEAHSWAGRLQKLAEASSIVASTRSLDTLPSVIAEQARTIVSAKFCMSCLSIDAPSDTVGMSSSEEYAAWRGHTDSLNVLGKTASRAMRLSQAELEAQPAWRKLIEQIGRWDPVCGWLAVPITGANKQHLGVIQLFDTAAGEFSAQDEALLVQFAQVAGLALENALLRGEARQTLQARDEFLSLVAHELKNPITSLRGFAQLVLRQLDRGEAPEPERLRRSLQSIEQQSVHMTRLVNDLREASRLDGGRVTLELKRVDLVALAESVAAALQMGASCRPVQVHESEPAMATVDPFRWRQALTYLVEYVSASSTGSSPIEIQAVNHNTRAVDLAIIDRESSMSSGDWQQLVERVRRSHSPASLGGTGLNLYFAYRMIRLHGGALDVEPLADGGIRIVISLPAGLEASRKGEPV